MNSKPEPKDRDLEGAKLMVARMNILGVVLVGLEA